MGDRKRKSCFTQYTNKGKVHLNQASLQCGVGVQMNTWQAVMLRGPVQYLYFIQFRFKSSKVQWIRGWCLAVVSVTTGCFYSNVCGFLMLALDLHGFGCDYIPVGLNVILSSDWPVVVTGLVECVGLWERPGWLSILDTLDRPVRSVAV